MTPSHASRLRRSWLLLWTLGLVGVLGTGRAAAQPHYAEHQQLLYTLNDQGDRCHITTVKQWEIRRQHITAHMQRVMGQSVMGQLSALRQRVPLAVETVEDQVLGGLRRRKLRYHTDSNTEFVSAWLLEPVERSGRAAAILCLHPTVAIGKDEPAGVGGNPDKHYALHLARRGYVTLAPDYPSLGESSHDFTADAYPSGSMQAIVDNIRSVDLLASLPSVDANRIGCIGHSLGGHNTLFTATFDPRLKVCVSNCGFTRFHKYYRGDLSGWSGSEWYSTTSDAKTSASTKP